MRVRAHRGKTKNGSIRRRSSKEIIVKMRTEGKQRMEVSEEDRQKRSFSKCAQRENKEWKYQKTHARTHARVFGDGDSSVVRAPDS